MRATAASCEGGGISGGFLLHFIRWIFYCHNLKCCTAVDACVPAVSEARSAVLGRALADVVSLGAEVWRQDFLLLLLLDLNYILF